MKLIILSVLYGITLAHKMGDYITCLEQNEETPYGFREKYTYAESTSLVCQNYPELCRKYVEDEPYPGFGDVCDHEDPTTHNTRNACKVAIMFGATIDEEKTYSWKCADLAVCPLPGREGCKITNKRIMCCCQSDFCTDGELYAKYAAYGRPDKFPVDFDELLAIPTGDVEVVIDIPGYPGYVGSDDSPEYDSISKSEEEPEYASWSSDDKESAEPPNLPLWWSNWQPWSDYGSNYGLDARDYMYAHKGSDNMDVNVEGNQDAIGVTQLILIFAYFIIGTICLGLGVCIGVRWKSNVQKKANDLDEWNDGNNQFNDL